jgi:hypothetical protein
MPDGRYVAILPVEELAAVRRQNFADGYERPEIQFSGMACIPTNTYCMKCGEKINLGAQFCDKCLSIALGMMGLLESTTKYETCSLSPNSLQPKKLTD